jgi:hypothetical protein
MDQDKMQLRFLRNSIMSPGFLKKYRISNPAENDFRFIRKALLYGIIYNPVIGS